MRKIRVGVNYASKYGIIPTHDMHQWLLLQFLVLLMMDAENFRNM